MAIRACDADYELEPNSRHFCTSVATYASRALKNELEKQGS